VNAKANNTVDKARQLREKLYFAAKTSPALYDKVYRTDFLEDAWEQVKRNRGSAGVDGERITDILSKVPEHVLGEIQETLEAKRYRPKSVKRIYIPKPDERRRPLGIYISIDYILYNM